MPPQYRPQAAEYRHNKFDDKLPHVLGRLTLLGRLGEGASATVYRAEDAVRGDVVAVKILTEGSVPVATLKREFRRAVGLTHPNIVFPLDLFEVDGFVCLTMALIEGADFLTAVRPNGALDVVRLRAVFGDLAAGVSALHAHQLVHGDLKPSNVIVMSDGRAVVVDLGHARDGRDPADGRLGAFVYAAPDVIDEGVGNQQGDWYSIGVMLFQALTGALPFSLTVPVMYVEKQAPPIASAGPDDLIALCHALMHPDPAQRATVSDVFRCLGRLPTPATPSESPFVGRERELASILGAVERMQPGVPTVVHLTGPSGVGKSRLGRRLVELLEARAVCVLHGRCYARDLTLLRAIDGCVDQLATYLLEAAPDWADACSEDERTACAALFPALMPGVGPGGESSILPRERRAWDFAVLGRAFAALASRRPLVVLLDDLQWGDELSARALREVLATPGIRIACVLVYRAESIPHEPSFIADLLAGERTELRLAPLNVALAPLADTDAAALATALNLAPTAANAAHGMPFFIELLAQSQGEPKTISGALSSTLDALDPDACALLNCVCLSSRALDHDTLTHMSALTSTRTESLLNALEQQRLVRVTTPRAVEPYHDVLRAAVVDAMSATERRVIHRHLGHDARAASPPDHAAAAMHLRAASDFSGAQESAEAGATDAKARLAFEEVLSLYTVALDCDRSAPSGRRHILLEAASHAAGELGRSRIAAEFLMQCVDDVEGSLPLAEADGLRQRACGLFIQAGLLAEGLAATEELRKRLRIKVPKGGFHARISFMIAFFRATTTRHRRHRRGPPSLRTQTLFELGRGLMLCDFIRGSTIMFQATHNALREGSASIAAYGRLTLAAMRAHGGRPKDIVVASALLASGRELAIASGDARAILYAAITQATCDFAQGHHTAAVNRCDQAATVIAKTCPNAMWERTMAEAQALCALEQQGMFSALIERVERMRRRADEAGDLALHVESEIFSALGHLVRDHPEFVRPGLDSAIASWGQDSFSIHHWNALRIGAMHDLYIGPEPWHLSAFEAQLKRAKRAGQDGIQIARVEFAAFSARYHLALAALGRAPLAASAIRRHIRALRREERPYARARAAAIEAGLAMLEGDRTRARNALRRAVAHHAESDNPLERAMCMAKLAELEGAPRPIAAITTFAVVDLTNERAWFNVFLPGLSHKRP